jgi:hypothetical protein
MPTLRPVMRPPPSRAVRVRRAGAVTSFAADAHLRVGGVEGVRLGVVALSHRGGVAVGAHVVPVLEALRPVQLVGVGDAWAGKEEEPPLAPVARRARIPRLGERLDPPIREGHEVLLERIHAEGVAHRVLVLPAVRALGAHERRVAAPHEGGGDARVRERLAAEGRQHRARGGALHGHGVLRAHPGRGLRQVAARAARGAHEARGLRLLAAGGHREREAEGEPSPCGHPLILPDGRVTSTSFIAKVAKGTSTAFIAKVAKEGRKEPRGTSFLSTFPLRPSR